MRLGHPLMMRQTLFGGAQNKRGREWIEARDAKLIDTPR